MSTGQYEFFVGYGSRTQPALIFKIYSTNINKIQFLTIRYLVIESFWGNFVFWWFLQPVQMNIYSTSTYSVTVMPGNSVTYDSLFQSFAVLTGFQITIISGNTLSLSFSAVRFNSTHLTLTLSSTSITPIYVN